MQIMFGKGREDLSPEMHYLEARDRHDQIRGALDRAHEYRRECDGRISRFVAGVMVGVHTARLARAEEHMQLAGDQIQS